MKTAKHNTTGREHKILILRLWRDRPDQQWRMAIQAPHDGEPTGLPDAAALNRFVLSLIQE